MIAGNAYERTELPSSVTERCQHVRPGPGVSSNAATGRTQQPVKPAKCSHKLLIAPDGPRTRGYMHELLV